MIAGRRTLLAMAASLAFGNAAANGGGDLQCSLAAPAEARAGQPVMLRFTVRNTGPRTLALLDWNTPFEEAWFSAYVQVWRDGAELPYQGPMVKRAEPSIDQYFRLGPGESRTAEVDLALPFDLHPPGLYKVQPRIQLHDVADGSRPLQPSARRTAQALACNAVSIRVLP